jgi:hypothetical protein
MLYESRSHKYKIKINKDFNLVLEKVLLALLKEENLAGSHPEETYVYDWPEFNEKEFDKDGMTTWHEDREWTKQYLKDMGMLK